MFKTIIVHVDESPLTDARVRAAAWLANAHGAHLVGSAATGMSWAAYAMLAGSMGVTPVDEYESLRTLARANLRRFGERATQLGVQSLEQRLGEEENRDALLLQARYADLVVTGQDAGDAATVRGLPQYLAMHGARPVLVVPPSYADEPIADIVVVGWDGSMPAIRAIAGAMPVLARARAVRLALLNPDLESGLHGDEPGADMALYLARHGVQVEVLIERTQASTGDALLGIVRASGAGLLVAGAFGHSRYREIVLGGVTRLLLDRAPVPVLLAH
ncbi:MAG: universal stress protein [Telluria sp.]